MRLTIIDPKLCAVLKMKRNNFRDFLNRLRAAKDKTEFDQFMADRRGQAGDPAVSPQS